MFRSNLLYLSAAAIALAAAAQPAAGQAVAPPPVPTDIQVPAGNTAYLKGYAMGTQNYVCLPGDAGLAWKFQGPQATVFYQIPVARRRRSAADHDALPQPEPDGNGHAGASDLAEFARYQRGMGEEDEGVERSCLCRAGCDSMVSAANDGGAKRADRADRH